MKTLIIAFVVLASAFAQAADVTLLSTDLPVTRGQLSVDTKFHIDTDMKEGFAKISVEEQFTVYVRNCYNGGYYGPRGPGFPRPYPGPNYPGSYCQTIPQTQYRTIMTDKVKIPGLTMNGDEVIYQGADGDVVCGTMGRSRVFRVPTFYLSGKCELVGRVLRGSGSNKLIVTFKTK